MVRRVTGRLCTLVVALLALSLAFTAPVTAAPKSAKPTSVAIEGSGLSAPIVLSVEDDPELFAAVLGQVSWMATKNGQAAALKPEKLGPRYVIVVRVKGKATQAYHLFPLASGGPRAHRPAKQPDKRKVSAAWFYGRLSMSETLRAAGVPLPERPDVLTGGVGGGGRIGTDGTLEPAADLAKFLAELRRLLLLNGAVVVVITLGLAGFALLIRYRTERTARARQRA